MIRLPAVDPAERACPELGTDPGVPSLSPHWPRSRRGMGESPIAGGSTMNPDCRGRVDLVALWVSDPPVVAETWTRVAQGPQAAAPRPAPVLLEHPPAQLDDLPPPQHLDPDGIAGL